jgi:glycosyltransferase involved in cell wall biosynthesis
VRVLHLIPSLGSGGGAEQVLLQLLPALRRAGVEASVAALWGPNELQAPLEVLGVPVRSLGLDPTRPWNLARGAWEVRRLLEDVRPDVTHAHLYFGALHASAQPPRLTGSRVLTFHNVDYELYPARSAPELLRKALHRLAMSRFSGFIAVSETVREHYRLELGVQGAKVIPNALDLPALAQTSNPSSRARERMGLEDQRPLVLLPGRLVRQKGHACALRASEALWSKGMNFLLAFAGRGPLQDELQATVARSPFKDRVRFLGVLDHQQFLEVMRAADVVIMPSTHEGFGIVGAEAMALGRALIASDIGPLRELVLNQQTGVLVPPEQPALWARAIGELLEDSALRSRLGGAATAAARSRFGSDRIAAATLEVYRAALAAPRH